MSEAILTFWGVRGSIASPERHTLTYGGNTSCISIEYHDYFFIFDGGTGIRNLGKYLMSRKDLKKINGNIFLTHLHWDHIQGLPFFIPAFLKENQFSIYAEKKGPHTVDELIKEQLQAPFFPVDYDHLYHAHIDFNEIKADKLVELEENVTILPIRLTHPNTAVGYLLNIGKCKIAYITDHEMKVNSIDKHLLEKIQDIDVLIHDSQYSREEILNGKKGWGHSAWEDVLELGIAANVTSIFLTHHDPDRTDDELNERRFLAQRKFQNTFIARERMKIPLQVK